MGIVADRTAVCESVVGSCRMYITIIPHPQSRRERAMLVEDNMLTRRAKTSSSWKALRGWVEHIRRIEESTAYGQLLSRVASSCSSPVLLVHDIWRLFTRSKSIVRALRDHDANNHIVIVDGMGLGVLAVMSIATQRRHVVYKTSSCDLRNLVEDVWWRELDLPAAFRDRLSATCEDNIHTVDISNAAVVFLLDACWSERQSLDFLLTSSSSLIRKETSAWPVVISFHDHTAVEDVTSLYDVSVSDVTVLQRTLRQCRSVLDMDNEDETVSLFVYSRR